MPALWPVRASRRARHPMVEETPAHGRATDRRERAPTASVARVVGSRRARSPRTDRESRMRTAPKLPTWRTTTDSGPRALIDAAGILGAWEELVEAARKVAAGESTLDAFTA